MIDHPRIVVSLRAPARIEAHASDRIIISAAGSRIELPPSAAVLTRALELLVEGATNAVLLDTVREGGPACLPLWYYHVAALERSRLVTYEAHAGARPLARAVPISRYFEAERHPPSADRRWLMSRFVYARRKRDRLVLESPLSCATIELLDPAAASVFFRLAAPATCSEVAAAANLPRSAADDVLSLLAACSMIAAVDPSGTTSEDSPSLRTWHFADLLFHNRSRRGRHDEPIEVLGFEGDLPPLPAVKPPMSGDVIPLYAPDVEHLLEHDAPFTAVLETRQSLRTYAPHPITVEQLGEFLHRSARVKQLISPDGDRIRYEASARPYPGAGACYELEVYVVAGTCAGLSRGFYHYDPLRHVLERVRSGEPLVPEFLRGTHRSADGLALRQILILISARFQRVSWKYNSSSYAAVLKDVGVLLQTLYLVATAMHLAGCALGNSDIGLFARAAGLAFTDESPVGEFLLGSRAAADD